MARPVAAVLSYFKKLGPGLITGASDDDPSGISTYSVAGASTGLSTLWLALITTPMMAVIQGMCARIGMVTGVGLAATMRNVLPLWLSIALGSITIIANTFNIGADIAGMAGSATLVFKLPPLVWVFIFGLALIFGQVFLSYRVLVSTIKYLTLSLLAYVVTAFVVHPNWLEVLRHAVVPEFRLNGRWITTVVGVLGTTITPYLFFWQSALMVEEDKSRGLKTLAQRKGTTQKKIDDAHIDVNSGMIASNAVMFFIIVTTASTLGAHGQHNIQSAQEAAEALRPLAGNFAYLLFALGMIGTGLLAVPSLAGSSAYVTVELLGLRRSGLGQTLEKAPRFYSVLAISMVAGIVMNLLHVDPIKALFWSAVLNGITAVPLLVAVVLIASNRRVMGKWTSSVTAQVWGWLTVVLMGGAAVAMFVFWNQQ